MRWKLTLPLLLASTLMAQTTQTWFKVADESSISVTIPAGVTWRWGTPKCGLTGAPAWSASQVGPKTINPLTMAAATTQFGVPDPCQLTAKELDILETTVVQTVTVAGKPVTVPALLPPPPTTTMYACTYPAGSFTATVTSTTATSFTAPVSVTLSCTKQ